MSNSADAAPIFEPVVDDNGKANLAWVLFFNSIVDGDLGTAWTPTFTGLTETGGSAAKTGIYYRVIGRLCYFRLTITPVTSTSSTAGSTYVDNFPITSIADGFCVAITGSTGVALGTVVSATNRIYVPSWSAITTPITIVGVVEVSS